MSTTTPEQTGPERTGNRVLRYWPVAAGIAVGVLSGYGVAAGADLAPVLTASGLVYLGAAALQRRGAAWPVFFVAFVVIGASRFLPWEDAATWVLLGFAAAFALYGLVRGAIRPFEALPLQSLAMVLFGGASVLVLIIGGDTAAYIVAAGLLAHAGWDAWHHRTGRVVVRSMTEFCMFLDVIAAGFMIAAALA
ncbi:hypothetical protein SAMN05216298_1547 [Glycomyces sambucus]|uniref:Uncharacterized protein n=1 Tax=Glycomyces sambucus TaxID=380244 RepID=A0A1G9F3L0_9ACTN|nr:hypothetical protein [Glycomyces sambucus]SDK82992.1 hypothetical protein SAMN05216298_1547 [Glycomyces sambucus]